MKISRNLDSPPLSGAPPVTENYPLYADILCNLCGGSCRAKISHAGLEDRHVFLGAFDLAAVGGPDGVFPPDGDAWSFDLCQVCVARLVMHCRMPPTVRYLSPDGTTQSECPPTDRSRILDALLTGDQALLSLDELAVHDEAERAGLATTKRAS